MWWRGREKVGEVDEDYIMKGFYIVLKSLDFISRLSDVLIMEDLKLRNGEYRGGKIVGIEIG